MKVVSTTLLAAWIGVALLSCCVARAEGTEDKEVGVLLEALERDIAGIRKKAEADVRAATEKCLAQLQQLQDTYTKAGKLDEAVALRDRIRTLKANGDATLPDPGDLSNYKEQVGKVLYFEVTGSTGDWVWGSDIYTYDSKLATAAVHAGALKFGEKGVVKVTILPGKASYEATERNGVSSRTWTAYNSSYKVEPLAGKAAK